MRESPVHIICRSFLLAFFSVVASSPNLSTCLLKSAAKVRISERFAKEMIKREQKKFTFYAEREFLRPSGQIYLRKSEREYLRPTGQLDIATSFAILCHVQRSPPNIYRSSFQNAMLLIFSSRQTLKQIKC